ncbi:hypothetical protein EBZ39_12830 [bacterium]|nr:hypothetical protein [bacterium]
MARRKIPEATIAKALTASHGNISLAARNLGIERESLHHRIAASANLKQIVLDARESLVDHAESALARAVINGEAWAVCFTLKTIGKSRGYIERHEINSTETVRRQIVEEIVDVQITHHRPDNDQAAPSPAQIPSLPGPV